MHARLHSRFCPGNQKNKSTALIAQNNAFVIPLLSAPKCFLKRLAVLACTRSNCRILYSEVILRGTLSGQHLGYSFRTIQFSTFVHGANRFFLWWLFLHRRLRSRQRGSFCNERLSCFLAVPFQKVSFVFIRTTRKVLRLF